MMMSPYETYTGGGGYGKKKYPFEMEDVYCSLNYSDVNSTYNEDLDDRQLLQPQPPPPPRQYMDPWDLENYAYLQRYGL